MIHILDTQTIGNVRIDLMKTPIDFRIWATDVRNEDMYLASPIVTRTLDDAKDAFSETTGLIAAGCTNLEIANITRCIHQHWREQS